MIRNETEMPRKSHNPNPNAMYMESNPHIPIQESKNSIEDFSGEDESCTHHEK